MKHNRKVVVVSEETHRRLEIYKVLARLESMGDVVEALEQAARGEGPLAGKVDLLTWPKKESDNE